MKSLLVLAVLFSPLVAVAGPLDFTGQPGGTDPTNQRAIQWQISTGSALSTPNFSNETGLELVFNTLAGQNDRDGSAKKTFAPLSLVGNQYGAGQRFLYNNKQNCLGMGDCFISSDIVTSAAGVNDAGGEGTAFRTMLLQQQPFLTKTTIATVPTQSTCTTTLTQAVIKQKDPQPVTVTSTDGCQIGDWVTVDRGQLYWTDEKIEAVQITDMGAGTLSGIFRHAHSVGGTITPATVLILASKGMGELRYLVNLSAPAVTTGTISATSGTSITGVNTAWDATMVGGDATLPGCIALTADDYGGIPFSAAQPLKSWYGISSVVSPTALNLAHRSVVGVVSYIGNGPGPYTVRPCARILKLIPNPQNTALTGQVILETNTFPWTSNDSVELAISVDGDVTGEFMRAAWYTPGTALRGIYTAWNTGPQRFDSAYRAVGLWMNLGQAFRAGLSVEARVGVGVSMTGVTDNGAMDIGPRAAVDDKRIKWGSRFIGPPVTDNSSLEIQGTQYGAGGKLSLRPPSSGDSLPTAEWLGHLSLLNPGTGQQPRLRWQRTPTAFLALQMVHVGTLGGQGLQGVSSDFGTRPTFELLSTGTSGVTAFVTNAISDATATTNYGSFWQTALASTWNGTGAIKTYFSQRLTAETGVNAHTSWELRAGVNPFFAYNPVAMSLRDDGVVKMPSVAIGQTGKVPLCIDAATGQLYAGTNC